MHGAFCMWLMMSRCTHLLDKQSILGVFRFSIPGSIIYKHKCLQHWAETLTVWGSMLHVAWVRWGRTYGTLLFWLDGSCKGPAVVTYYHIFLRIQVGINGSFTSCPGVAAQPGRPSLTEATPFLLPSACPQAWRTRAIPTGQMRKVDYQTWEGSPSPGFGQLQPPQAKTGRPGLALGKTEIN